MNSTLTIIYEAWEGNLALDLKIFSATFLHKKKNFSKSSCCTAFIMIIFVVGLSLPGCVLLLNTAPY